MEVNSTTHCWSILDSATSKQCHILLYILYIGMNRIVSCWPSLPYHVETKAWFEVEVSAAELVNTMVAFSSTVYVRYSPLCLPKYSVLPTVADAAPPHLTLSYYIVRYTASTSINGSSLYYTLPIHSWFSYIQTVSYSFIYCYEQSNIMLAFPSIPCWDSSMIWWGAKQ